MTPEAKVSAAVDKYLKTIRAINIRTNAGSWADDAGHVIQGAKAGTSDKTCCLPNGIFCAVETKSAKGKLTEPQERYLARVEAMGGIAIVARSAADVQAALVERFGAALVASWAVKEDIHAKMQRLRAENLAASADARGIALHAAAQEGRGL